MISLYELMHRVADLFRRGSAERRLDEEMRFHIDLETEELVRQGLSPEAARRQALLRFGAMDAHKESTRDERGFRWLEDFGSDARYAARWLRRSPAFTVVAVLTLAIGIGAITSIFTLVEAVFLRPLPYRDAGRLGVVYAQNLKMGERGSNISYMDYLDWKREVKSFAGLGIFQWTSSTLTGDGEAARVPGAQVSADLFRVLGAQPILGRAFTREEEAPGRNRVVILGYGLWQRRYGGERSVLGRTIQVDGEPYTVVGVMPPGFQFPYAGEVWTPFVPEDWMMERANRAVAGAIARLRPGVDREQAEAELARVSRQLQRRYPNENRDWEGQYVGMREDLFGPLRTAVVLLFAGASLLLLIVCGNVTNLLLARSAAREREVAVRAAIGAGRGRLVRQLLTESLVLTTASAALGLLLAYWGMHVLRGMLADRLPAFVTIEPRPAIYAFALAVTGLVAFLAGVLPALRGSGVDEQASLKQGGRTTEGRRGSRLRGGLVAAEVALAVILLIGSTLLLKSMNALAHVDPGFDYEHVLVARFYLPASKYESAERRRAFMAALEARLRAQPGVRVVGAAQGTPFSGWNVQRTYAVEGQPAPAGEKWVAHQQRVTPEFFRALGVPMVRGRALAPTDDDRGPPVAVVNESFAERHFRGADPIGQRVRFGRDTAWATIVGVVKDYRHYRLTEPMGPAAYTPFAVDPPSQMMLAMRTEGDPAALAPALRRALQDVDPDVPADRVASLSEIVSRQTWVQRVSRDILGAFAAIAALLAVVGLYGVISYSVARQRNELGIRLALGATPGAVLRLVVRQGLRLALLGIAVGWIVAFIASKSLAQLLFEVRPADAVTFVIVPAIVAVLAALAALFPGRRAASMDPVVALRSE